MINAEYNRITKTAPCNSDLPMDAEAVGETLTILRNMLDKLVEYTVKTSVDDRINVIDLKAEFDACNAVRWFIALHGKVTPLMLKAIEDWRNFLELMKETSKQPG